MQFALQLPLQLALQEALAEPVQPPLQETSSWAAQEAWKFIGVQFAVQPPEVSSVHCALAWTSMLPHDDRMSARATLGVNANTSAAKAKTGARTNRRSIIGIPPEREG